MKAQLEAPSRLCPAKPVRALGVWAVVVTLGVAAVATAQVERVSVRSDGKQANGPSSGAATNQDGSCVAFWSDATNLLPTGAGGDTNGARDVFVFHRDTGLLERVSISSTGEQANGRSQAQGFLPAIDASCTCVAFSSDATNLVPGDTNGTTDIFVRDLVSGTTERVSVGQGGEQANGPSSFATVSGDCRFVAFSSTASNLVPGDTNKVADVFVHDRGTGETRRVSIGAGGIEGDGMSITPSISADGRCVAFASAAGTLWYGDTNGKNDIYVACDGTVSCRASVSSDGQEANGDSFLPSLNADGGLVAFKSLASNLVDGDLNHSADVFVHDCGAATTERVSITTRGEASNDDNFPPSISGDGRFVAFGSFASNLAEGLSTGGKSQIYVRDRVLDTTMVISRNRLGRPGNGSAPDIPPSISLDGSFVAFASLASDLVTGDTNEAMDAFVGPNTTATPTRTPTATRTPTPLPCVTDADCPAGELCVDHRCATPTPTSTATPTPTDTPPVPCAVTEDCPPGLVCADGVCRIPTPSATATATPTVTNTPTPTQTRGCCFHRDCALDEICVGEPAGVQCVGNVCQRVACRSEADCPGDTVCVNGMCKEATPVVSPTPMPTCTTDEDCTPPERCRAGVCVPPRQCDDQDPVLDRVNCRGDRETCVNYTCECGGDCNFDGLVFGTEIARMVCILSGDEACPLSMCPAGDFDQDGEIVGTEACRALTNLGFGCPGEGLPLVVPRDLSEDERHLEIGSATGHPGGNVTIGLSLSEGQEVATVQMDILLDTNVFEVPDPATACTVTPDLNLTHAVFNFLPQRPDTPVGMARLRIFIADLMLCREDLSSLLDSFRAGPLASCTFKIRTSALHGTFAITGERQNIGDMRGNEFGSVVDNGSVTVVPCTDDSGCPNCYRCDEGVCRPRCDGADGCPTKCPDDMACVEGLCFEPECTVPADCNPVGAPLRRTCVGTFCKCTGDCNGDGEVFGTEVTKARRILLGDFDLGECPAADANGDGEVLGTEITLSRRNLLEGCPARPSVQ